MKGDNYKLYVHIFPNDKMYFGITKQAVKDRWQNGFGYKKQPKIFNAIQLYGWDNIVHEVLYANLTADDAVAKEKEFIEKYNTIEQGYNDDGGGGTGSCERIDIEYKDKIYKPSELEGIAVDGVSAHDLTTRLGRGWDIERAIIQPKQDRTYKFLYEGEKYSIEELMEFTKTPLSKDQLYGRIWRGWDIERALSQPTNCKKQPYWNKYKYRGQFYTVKELADISPVKELTEDNVRDRIYRGWDIERVVNQRKRKSPKK